MVSKTLATYTILNYLSDRKKDIIDMYIPLVASLVVKDNLPTIERNNVCKMFREEYGISSLTYGAMESILNRMTKQDLPCISTREGGIPDIIQSGRTGLLVERQNARDLADKIAWMIDHKIEREIMGRQGIHRYKELFTLKSFEYDFKDIFETVSQERK